MSIIPPQERHLHEINQKLAEQSKFLEGIEELLGSINAKLADISENTRPL